jgi:hypothetical protein
LRSRRGSAAAAAFIAQCLRQIVAVALVLTSEQR